MGDTSNMHEWRSIVLKLNPEHGESQFKESTNKVNKPLTALNQIDTYYLYYHNEIYNFIGKGFMIDTFTDKQTSDRNVINQLFIKTLWI